jgi:hypothetical protein
MSTPVDKRPSTKMLSESAKPMKSYWLLVGAVLPLCVLGGCGRGERLTVYPVQGKVLVVGIPAGNASVFFYPCDPTQQRISTATTASDGTFWLTTFVSGDGAPEGEYDVTVVWPDYSIPRDECADPLHDRLKLRYADRKKTELHATIRPRKNEVTLNVLMGGWSLPR